MTDLISYFRKTKATELLEQHFKPLSIAPNPAHVSFLHQINESACGGDDVSETPFAIILTDDESGRSVLISRTDTCQVVFHGFFDNQHGYFCPSPKNVKSATDKLKNIP